MTASQPPVARIELGGGARSRGRRYGEAAGAQIAVSLSSYGKMFAVCGMNWQQVAERARPFEAVIERAFPQALEEIHGIAEGSGVPFGTLLALNARTELLPPDYHARVAALAGAAPSATGAVNECTSFAVAPSMAASAPGAGAGGSQASVPAVWLAQNWDWLGGQRDALVLLDVTPDDGPRYLTVTEAGMLAKIGCNQHGLGVTLNILRSFDDGQLPGLPVHILLRALLACDSVAQALEFSRLQPHYTSSSNVLMADAGGAVASLECSPRAVRVLEPAQGRLWHTNHFLDQEQAGFDANLVGNNSTIARFGAASELLGADSEPMNLAAAQMVLSDGRAGFDSICRFPNPAVPAASRVETVASVIMNLVTRELWVSPAQPSLGGFVRHQIAAPAASKAVPDAAPPGPR